MPEEVPPHRRNGPAIIMPGGFVVDNSTRWWVIENQISNIVNVDNNVKTSEEVTQRSESPTFR